MRDCPHKQPMKLFIIHRDTPDSCFAGYFVCPDCGDYVCTGWVDEEDVWNEDTVLYSMQKESDNNKSDAFEKEPISIFKTWIRDDLADRYGNEKLPELLPP